MNKKPLRKKRKIITIKNCYFCDEKKLPHFMDSEILSRFLTERGKIIGRSRNGLCAKHQRRVTTAIKHARHLALLPFLVRV
ncbi:MAG: 30S ribosomal protein S18 [Patescibacteria group bacterium]